MSNQKQGRAGAGTENATHNYHSPTIIESSSINIPSHIFKDRNLKVLETLVEFLKDEKKLTYHEIALLLNRDDRTIWTVYHRAQKKRMKQNGIQEGSKKNDS